MTPSGKIRNIQALRGAAILVVALYHIMLHERKYGFGALLLPDFFRVGAFGVDLFFIISGFVLTLTAKDQFHNIAYIKHFYWNRVTRIYPTYWFYSILFILVFYIFPQSMVTTSIGSAGFIIKSFLLIPQKSTPILSVGWTLFHEMYFYLAFSVFMLVHRKHLVKCLAVFLVFVALGNRLTAVGGLDSNAWLKLAFHPLTLEFIAGAMIAELIYKAGVMRWGLLSLTAGLLGLFCTSTLFLDASWNEPAGWSRALVFGVPAALIVYGAIAYELRNKKTISIVLEVIGNASYSIYLSHTLVISAVGVMYARMPSGLREINAMLIFLMLASSIVWGLISYRVIEAPMLTAARRLKNIISNGRG